MLRTVLFCEDAAHEFLLEPLVRRVCAELSVDIEVTVRSARGGYGVLTSRLREFVGDLKRAEARLPDILVVGTDANCKGRNARQSEVLSCLPDALRPFVVCAIPDPHIERWMLIDSSAFKRCFDIGCSAPDQKCERDRYKTLLRDQIERTGIYPSLGGMEFAEEIVAYLDLERAQRLDKSFGAFVQSLQALIKRQGIA